MKRKTLHIAAVTAALLASTSLVQAQPASPAKPKVEAAAIVDTIYDLYQGDVVKIDAKTRTITFKNREGESNFVAGPEIKNFAQIKVGDHLSVTYEVAVALELIKTKSDGIRSKQEASAVTTAQPGQKPAQTITNATEIIADVVAVDRTKKTASIKGPNVKVTVVKVKNPEFLKDIAVGDVVRALFIDRMAASITPGKK